MGLSNEKPTQCEIIQNSQTETLYTHDLGKKNCSQIVFSDEGFDMQVATKTMMRVIYKRENGVIEGLEILKCVDDEIKERVKFNKINIDQLRKFLELITDLNLGEISDRKIKLKGIWDDATKKEMNQLLQSVEGIELVEKLLSDGLVTSKDIVNTGYRRKSLNEMRRLINEKEYWKVYGEEKKKSENVKIDTSKPEKVLQYFFMKNQWIFGYGLDYRFQSILQKEWQTSNTSVVGKGAEWSDFLLGDKFFTTFVEIKTPETSLFKDTNNRANTWHLSTDLMDAVSQILEHKSSGQIKLSHEELKIGSNGNKFYQQAYDSKVILIIGNLVELESSKNDFEREVKKKTFELFRRDSRNIEILTYDELLTRAEFIVNDNSD